MSEVDMIHRKLLGDIYESFDINSREYHTFEGCMKSMIPLGVLKAKKTLLDKFDALHSRGLLGVGNYATLKKIAEESHNKNVLDMIKKAEEKIKKANNGEVNAEILTILQEEPGCGDALTDKVKCIHRQLLNHIYEIFDVNSIEYNRFVDSMMPFVPKGTLSEKETLLDKFDALEAKGCLEAGSYETLKIIAKDCNNIDVLGMIKKTEEEIKKVRDEEPGTKDAIRGKRRKNPDGDSKITKVITNQDMVMLSKHIGTNWEMLGYRLEFTAVEIDHFKRDNETTCLQVLAMLRAWTTKEGKNATSKNLLSVMKSEDSVTIDWDIIREHFEIE